MSEARPDLSTAAISIPEHVVTRDLSGQTIVLNLNTGQYYGLNATGGAMLEHLKSSGSAKTAAAQVASGFGAPEERVLGDLLALCGELLSRGLIEVDAKT
jgi:hypothetical protein